MPCHPDAQQGYEKSNDGARAVQESVKAGCYQNHAREARLGHHPLLSRAGGSRSMYSPTLRHPSDWWSWVHMTVCMMPVSHCCVNSQKERRTIANPEAKGIV